MGKIWTGPNILAVKDTIFDQLIRFIWVPEQQTYLPSVFLFQREMGCEHSLIYNTFDNRYQPSKNKHLYPQKISQHSLKYLPPPHLQPISKELSGKDILLINRTLQSHLLFYKLTKQQRMKVIESMEKFRVAGQTYIFRENDEPNYAFIIIEGYVHIEIQLQGKIVRKVLGQGELFGDLALINVTSRSASAYAQTSCELIALSKDTFQLRMQQLAKDNHAAALKYVSSSTIFGKFTEMQRKSIAHNMNQAKFEENSIIFSQGNVANCLYLIKSGEVEIAIPDRPSVVLKQGDVFGQGCLKRNSQRIGEAKALKKTFCLIITCSRLAQCIQMNDIKRISYDCTLRWAFKRSPKFQFQANHLISRIIKEGNIKMVEDKQAIVLAGQQLNELIICLDGQFVVQDIFRSNRAEQVVESGIIIGETTDKIDTSTVTLVKKGKGNIFCISHTLINGILHDSSSSSLKQTQFTTRSIAQTSYPESNSIELKDLQCLQRYETIELGTILLVRHFQKKTPYVLHCLIKNEVIEYKKQSLIIRSKQINTSLSTNYIIPLLTTSRDKDYIYLLYKYYPNLTLEYVYNQKGSLNNQIFQFMVANLVIRLEYMHERFIICRDLQAENWVIDEKGYPCLINFMMARQLEPQEGFKTYTIIGTPHFMAPEVHQGLGYSFSADIWSLGVLIYSLAVGYVPFGEGQEDPYTIFLAIQTQKPTFPPNFQNKKVKKLIKQLLTKESWIRPDLSAVRNVQFFSQYDDQLWLKLQKRMIRCPAELQRLLDNISIPDPKSCKLVSEFLEKDRIGISSPVRSQIDPSWDDFF